MNFFGDDASFHHIGLVVGQIDRDNRNLPIYSDPIQKVNVAFVEIANCPIELIEPIGDDSPITVALRKGNKLVHICFSVNDIAQSVKFAEEHGFKMIHSPTPATAFEGRNISWVYHPFWGLFELVEREKNNENRTL